MSISVKELNNRPIPQEVMDCIKDPIVENYINQKVSGDVIMFDGNLLRNIMDYLIELQQENNINDIAVNQGTMGVGYNASSIEDPMQKSLDLAIRNINKCYEVILRSTYEIEIDKSLDTVD